MKKKILSVLVLTVLIITAALAVACQTDVHTVRFYVDGKFLDSYTVKHGEGLDEIPEVPEKEGKTGTWDVKNFDEITADLRVNATYVDAYYTVKFFVDGELFKETNVRANSQLNDIPAVPAREGYIGSWSVTDFTKVDRNISVRAEYKRLPTIISFYVEEELYTTVSVEPDETPTSIPDVPRGDRDLSGKWVFKDGTDAVFNKLNGNISVYAEYYAAVTLVDGDEEKAAVCRPDEPVESFAAEDKEGYDFGGWYTDPDFRNKVTFPHAFSENTVLYCRRYSQGGDVGFSFSKGVLKGYNGTAAELTVPYKHVENDVEYFVTEIDDRAFLSSQTLEKITLPSTLRRIGDSAFRGCYSLTEVTFSDGNYVEEISDNAFRSCTSLERFAFSAFLEKIGRYSFYLCTALTEYEGFENTLVKVVPDYAFAENYELTTIALPSAVTEIGKSAFENDDKAGIYFPEATEITTVGENAFFGCGLLAEFFAPEIRNIGENAFGGCRSLNKLALPADVKLTSLFSDTDGGPNFYMSDGRYIPILLRNVYIAEGTGTVADGAVKNVYSIKRVELDRGVKVIGEEAFAVTDGGAQLGNLEVVFTNAVETVGARAFYGRTDLKAISLNASLREIGEYAFAESALEQLTIADDAIPYVGAGAFDGTPWAESYKGVIAVGRVAVGVTESFLRSVNRTELYVSDFKNISVIAPNAFAGNSLLTEIYLDNGIYQIHERAFADCPNLRSVTIGERTIIGTTVILGETELVRNSVLEGCPSLEKLEIGLDANFEELFGLLPADGFVYFKGRYVPATLSELTLFAGEKTIVDRSYDGLLSLKKITLGEGVTAIEDGAFLHCGAEEIILSSTVESIGVSEVEEENEGTFGPTLKRITYAEARSALKTIHDRAFYGTAVTEPVLPNTVERIGKYAFADLSAELSFVVLEDGETPLVIDDYAFTNIVFSHLYDFTLTLPSRTVTVGAHAFDGYRGTATVHLNDELKNLGEYAFANSSLKNFDIPASVELFLPDGRIAVGKLLAGTDIAKLTLRNPVMLSELFETVPETLTAVTVYGDVADFAFYGMSMLNGIELVDAATVGANAFAGCSGLRYVTLPATVTTLGDRAFANCSALENLTFAEGNELRSVGQYAFANDEKLISVYFPSTVTNKEYTGVFYNCKAMKDTGALPDTLTKVGYETFYGCESLRSLRVPAALEVIDDRAFYGCTLMELSNIKFDDLVSIGKEAFYGCARLRGIRAENVVTIGARAFYNCTLMEEITLAENRVSDIFYNAQDLLTVNLSSKINTVPAGMLVGCDNLRSVMIFTENEKLNELLLQCAVLSNECRIFVTKNGYNRIPSHIIERFDGGILTAPTEVNAEYAFDEEKLAATLVSVTYDGTVIYFPSYILNNGKTYEVTAIGSNVLKNSPAVTDLIIPYTVETIGASAFKNTALKTVTFETGSRLTTVGREAFRGCSALISLHLPDSVVTVDNAAFYETGLTEFAVSGFGALRTIGDYAFYGCEDLREITINTSALRSIGRSAFARSGVVKIYINTDARVDIASDAFEGCELTEENVVLPEEAYIGLFE